MASLATPRIASTPHSPVAYKGFRVRDLPTSFLALLGDIERKRNIDELASHALNLE